MLLWLPIKRLLEVSLTRTLYYPNAFPFCHPNAFPLSSVASLFSSRHVPYCRPDDRRDLSCVSAGSLSGCRIRIAASWRDPVNRPRIAARTRMHEIVYT
jgi:hypothetical protein